MTYEVVIGLEVHAQLLTRTKLFCSCSTQFGRSPNQSTCPVCLGLPGTLPVLNKQAVDFAIRAGLATNGNIAPKSVFARKNYFYPDLPKGYQISQYELPVIQGGFVEIDLEGQTKKIGLTRIHMEEDAGKLLHEHPETRSHDASWVDFNRGGVPLLEIVSEPEMRSPQEAVAYLKKLRMILIYIGVCDGNMEEGSLRCDANVSLRPIGEKKFGTKVELKNMNSFRSVERAIIYEIQRQSDVLSGGGRVTQETRLWDTEKEQTQPMRSKEEAHDYRYFPDPDLLPLLISEEQIAKIKSSLSELPDQKKTRFLKVYSLSESDAQILTGSRELADFFEECVREYADAKKVANWLINEYLRLIRADESLIAKSPLKPKHLAETLRLVEEGKISSSVAKSVLQKVFETGRSPKDIIDQEGLGQISDDSSLEKSVEEVLQSCPNEVDRYRKGDTKLAGFFMGQVMKKTGGRANPAKVGELIKKKLS